VADVLLVLWCFLRAMMLSLFDLKILLFYRSCLILYEFKGRSSLVLRKSVKKGLCLIIPNPKSVKVIYLFQAIYTIYPCYEECISVQLCVIFFICYFSLSISSGKRAASPISSDDGVSVG
jgi:hypothetical protein